jgi:hypothetical protein
MLKVVLTDGHSKVTGIELLPLSTLDCKTPPGTKVLLVGKTTPLVEGMLPLTPDTIMVVGGRVDTLIERWELQQNLAMRDGQRKVANDPDYIPFVPFSKVLVTSSACGSVNAWFTHAS